MDWELVVSVHTNIIYFGMILKTESCHIAFNYEKIIIYGALVNLKSVVDKL